MKRTYIQPSIVVFQIEPCNVVCASGSVSVTVSAETTNYLDAPRTRLWGSED